MSSESRIWEIRLFGSMRGGRALVIGPWPFNPSSPAYSTIRANDISHSFSIVYAGISLWASAAGLLCAAQMAWSNRPWLGFGGSKLAGYRTQDSEKPVHPRGLFFWVGQVGWEGEPKSALSCLRRAGGLRLYPHRISPRNGGVSFGRRLPIDGVSALPRAGDYPQGQAIPTHPNRAHRAQASVSGDGSAAV